MRDLYHNLTVRPVIAPAANANLDTTPLVGATIDHRGYDSALYVIQTGTLSDVDATYAVLLEESNASDMGSANAVADADLHNTEAAAGFTYANDGIVRLLGYKGSKRYTRLTITPTAANSGNSPISSVVVLGSPSVAPVN